MTREVAKREIESLDYYLQNHTNDYSEESHTAMVMAIKALEQDPKTGHPQKSCDTCEHSDEIDGSNCYECVKDMRNNYSPKKIEPSGDLISKQSVLNACEQSINILEAVDRIMDLPSVEQEPKTEQEDDYFRKIVEVAISQLRADRDRLEDELAKREQEPKTGHWIEKDGFDGDTYYDCSECGESFCLIDGTPTDNLYNYCPNCGCRMVESQESEDKE